MGIITQTEITQAIIRKLEVVTDWKTRFMIVGISITGYHTCHNEEEEHTTKTKFISKIHIVQSRDPNKLGVILQITSIKDELYPTPIISTQTYILKEDNNNNNEKFLFIPNPRNNNQNPGNNNQSHKQTHEAIASHLLKYIGSQIAVIKQTTEPFQGLPFSIITSNQMDTLSGNPNLPSAIGKKPNYKCIARSEPAIVLP